MCSVVGYIGKYSCSNYILKGLERLEYRGYDSAGFACIDSKTNQLACNKAQGEIFNLLEKQKANAIDGFVGIGHTRWATHGPASELNAHPHLDCNQEIAVVHNGIIENFSSLKLQLQQSGHKIKSNTDTELISHLIEDYIQEYKIKDLKQLLLSTVNSLDGAYSFVVLLREFPNTLLVARNKSPLCIGIGENKQEHFVASDLLAFAGFAKQAIFMPDESIALVSREYVEIYDFSGNPIPYAVTNLEDLEINTSKNGFEHFMLKEIYEQKNVIKSSLGYCKSLGSSIWDQLGISIKDLQNLKQINLVGCGSSFNAGSIAKYFFENICNIPTNVLLGSEFRHKKIFIEPNSIYIAVSQSGETADTLEGVRYLKSLGLKTIALTNVDCSSIVRECSGFILTKAGKEIAVASTKAFSAQLTVLYWLANFFALNLSLINSADFEQSEQDLLVAGQVLESSIELYKRDIESNLACSYARYNQAIFLGRHISYPFAQEASLKLKEISYIFTDCYPSGELKHGSLALVSDNIPVFIFSSIDKIIYSKLVANAQEVKARSANLVVFAFEDQHELIGLADTVFIFPRVKELLAPLAMTGLMQFFAYQIAKSLGRPIDKPRNLAKSVTVE